MSHLKNNSHKGAPRDQAKPIYKNDFNKPLYLHSISLCIKILSKKILTLLCTWEVCINNASSENPFTSRI